MRFTIYMHVLLQFHFFFFFFCFFVLLSKDFLNLGAQLCSISIYAVGLLTSFLGDALLESYLGALLVTAYSFHVTFLKLVKCFVTLSCHDL